MQNMPNMTSPHVVPTFAPHALMRHAGPAPRARVHVRRLRAKIDDPFRGKLIDRDGRAGLEFGVTGVPETFLIGSDGTILAKHSGPLTQADSEAMLAKAR